MLYESEPKVRRITEVKSKDIKSSERSNSNINSNMNVKVAGKSRANKNRRKPSSTHARSKNNTSLNSNNSPSTPSNASTNVTSGNKLDTKRPVKPSSAKSKDARSNNTGPSENTHETGKTRYLS